jgi:hypothetical protein
LGLFGYTGKSFGIKNPFHVTSLHNKEHICCVSEKSLSKL